MVERARILWEGLLDLIYPPQCLVCRALDRPTLCNSCRAAFERVAPPWCPICGRPHTTHDCPDCQRMKEEGEGWYFEEARSVAHYGGTLATAIQRLKYNRQELLAEPLGSFMIDRLASEPLFEKLPPGQFDLVVPVPLHQRRLRERGFNQAEQMARSVSRGLQIPLSPHGLRRRVATQQQANLSAKERRLKMNKTVFLAEQVEAVAGKRILLVDDVRTTGATLNAAACALKQAGAAYIGCLTLAVGG